MSESHHHHHHHNHQTVSRLQFAFFLNLAFSLLEIFGAVWTNSVSILADALHDLGDSLALLLAWLMQKISGRSRDEMFSYGYHRFSMLAALVNSTILIVGGLIVLFLAVRRLLNPEPVYAEGMIVFAVLGVAVNGIAAYRLHRHGNLNEQIVFWHLMEDALGWVAVLVGAFAIKVWQWEWLDPVMSIGITLFILWNVSHRFLEALQVVLQAVPKNTSLQKISETLRAINDVTDIHHVHLWSLDGHIHVCTAHLVVADQTASIRVAEIKREAKERLRSHHVEWVTIEIEFTSESCTSGTDLIWHKGP